MKYLVLAILLTFAYAAIEQKIKLIDDIQDSAASELVKIQPPVDLGLDTISKFFVVGDFGDIETYSNLEHVTDVMNQLSSNEKYDFIATVGDNVYEKGIESMSKLDTVNKIMNSFKKSHIKDTPMYLTLGNHD